MPTGYTRQSAAEIVTGQTVNASSFNNEFNAIQAAMDATTGHTHDGTVGGGAQISLATAVQGTLGVANGGTGATTAANARTNLGLGSIATQSAASVAITGGTIAGITDLAIGDGGTGASDAATARTNLGLGSIATQDAAAVSIGTLTTTGDVTIADRIHHAGDTDTAIRFPTNDTFTVETGGVERVRVTSAGTEAQTAVFGMNRVSLESTTAAAKVELLNDQAANALTNNTFNSIDFISTNANPNYKASIKGYVGGFSDQVGLEFKTYFATVEYTAVRLGAWGTVHFPSIGTTASAANAFLDSGASPANQLLRSTSSVKYKASIEDITLKDAEKVLELRPVTYKSKAPADDPNKVHLGFIAEEVHPVEPRLVQYVLGEPDGVQYERIIVPLLKVIQDLKQRIEALENTNG